MQVPDLSPLPPQGCGAIATPTRVQNPYGRTRKLLTVARRLPSNSPVVRDDCSSKLPAKACAARIAGSVAGMFAPPGPLLRRSARERRRRGARSRCASPAAASPRLACALTPRILEETSMRGRAVIIFLGTSLLWLAAGALREASGAEEELEYLGTRECFDCHEELEQPFSRNIHSKTSYWNEKAVGCEDCHGPASAHGESDGDVYLGSPADLVARQSNAVCNSCHDGDTGHSLLAGQHPRGHGRLVCLLPRRPCQQREHAHQPVRGGDLLRVPPGLPDVRLQTVTPPDDRCHAPVRGTAR